MKLILFLVISCVALHNGKGAPRTAVYKFVRCNPDSDQANCVTQRGPEMAWSPDLPAKLPALTAQNLEAEPEEESPPREEEQELKMDEGEEFTLVRDYGSGAYEGSAATSMADLALGETGSGESWAEKADKQYKGNSLSKDGSGAYEGSAATSMADLALGETGSGESWAEKDGKQYKDEGMRGMRRLFPGEEETREDHPLQL